MECVAGIAACHRQDLIQFPHLRSHIANTGDPEIARITGQIFPCLRHERRDDGQFRHQARLTVVVERKLVSPHFDDRMIGRPFVGRYVTSVHPHRVVKSRIPDPRL